MVTTGMLHTRIQETNILPSKEFREDSLQIAGGYTEVLPQKTSAEKSSRPNHICNVDCHI